MLGLYWIYKTQPTHNYVDSRLSTHRSKIMLISLPTIGLCPEMILLALTVKCMYRAILPMNRPRPLPSPFTAHNSRNSSRVVVKLHPPKFGGTPPRGWGLAYDPRGGIEGIERSRGEGVPQPLGRGCVIGEGIGTRVDLVDGVDMERVGSSMSMVTPLRVVLRKAYTHDTLITFMTTHRATVYTKI